MHPLLRAILVMALVAVIGLVAFIGWSDFSTRRSADRTLQSPTATTGTVDTAKARERAAEVGEKAAIAAAKVQETVAEARLTAKIKAKMALDDYVKARGIDVSTTRSTVTLSGTVASSNEHDRAVRLARETEGVSDIVDELRVSP